MLCWRRGLKKEDCAVGRFFWKAFSTSFSPLASNLVHVPCSLPSRQLSPQAQSKSGGRLRAGGHAGTPWRSNTPSARRWGARGVHALEKPRHPAASPPAVRGLTLSEQKQFLFSKKKRRHSEKMLWRGEGASTFTKKGMGLCG